MTGALLALSYIALLLFAMRRMPFFARVPGLPFRAVAGLLLLKVLAGTALWAVYTYVYPDRATADVFKYFDDSAVMFSALPDRPGDYLRMLFSVDNDQPWFDQQYYGRMNNWYRQWESNLHNDAHTVIRFNAVVRLISFGEFHVHTVVAAFLALTGMLALYRAFVGALAGRERALAISLFLLPTVLFWASGAIKESLLFFGLGLLLHQFRRFLAGERSVAGLALGLFGLVLLFHLKFYVLMSLLPALGVMLWARMFGAARPWMAGAVVFGGFAALALLSSRLPGDVNILEVLMWKQRDFIGLARATASGSFVQPPPLEATPWGFVRLVPYALVNTFLGPVVHPSGGILGLLSAAENIALLPLLLVPFLFRRSWRQVDGVLLVALAGYCLVLACVIGWTTPVMGALVRYRAPLYPFLCIVSLLLLDQERLLARWPRLKPFLSA
jgi:hypothetical protein